MELLVSDLTEFHNSVMCPDLYMDTDISSLSRPAPVQLDTGLKIRYPDLSGYSGAGIEPHKTSYEEA